MRKDIGDYHTCMQMANATTRMLIHWEPVVFSNFGSSDVYPSIFNYAFSCELYLKAIMMYRSEMNEFSLGHDLEKLFLQLNEQDQDAIRKVYERNSYDENGNKKLWEESFDFTLKEARNVFTDWRYAFSKDGMTVQVSRLISLSKAIRSVACRITGMHLNLPPKNI